jgi:hypothetical protein
MAPDKALSDLLNWLDNKSIFDSSFYTLKNFKLIIAVSIPFRDRNSGSIKKDTGSNIFSPAFNICSSKQKQSIFAPVPHETYDCAC